MACRFEITLDGKDAGFMGEAGRALEEVQSIEAQLSIFRETSALTRLNRCAAAGWVAVDRELLRLLMLCRTLHNDTDGAFDVTSTPLSRCWGFLQHAVRLPTPDEVALAREQVGMSDIEIDAQGRRVTFTRPGIEVSFGAIGKGWALDSVSRRLRDRGVSHALLSAGHSSVVALGAPSDPWSIDLTSPRVDRAFARVELEHGALGTSGAGEQFFEIDGRRYGHVLDPRTGWASDAGILSASVLTVSAAVSDALSTAFLVGGLDLARRYCASHTDVMAVMTLEDRSTHIVGEFRGAHVDLA